MQNTYLLESSVLVGGSEGKQTAEVQQSTDTGTATSAPTSSMSGFSIILIYVVIIAAMYYFTIRPSRKREKLIQEKQDEIKIGDQVITTSGMYGKVVDVNDASFNIEFGSNKSVIIPVNKKDVLPVGVDLNPKKEKKEKHEKNEKNEVDTTK